MLLTVEAQNKFEQLILDQDLIDADELQELKLEANKANKSLQAILSERNILSGEQLVKLNADANGFRYVNLLNHQVAPDVLELIPREVAENYRAVPIGFMKGRLAVGMIDPNNLQAVDFISRKIGSKPIKPFMVSEASINAVLDQYSVSREVSKVIGNASEFDEQEQEYKEAVEERGKAKTVVDLVQDAPVTRALKTILDHAAKSKASDIHIEPREESLLVRFRIDGILHEIMTLPKNIEPAIVSRVKILSDLKIDEHRLPQDGEFRVNVENRDIDIRVSIAPIVNGEQVVLRLLDKDDSLLSFEKMGFRGRALEVLKAGINRPHGMTLATGPTGSGKSTTLYTCLNTIYSPEINIITLEDPVEYKMDGINQIQINTDIGLTFASGLRSVLRQDPDVVMVGEIRDHETGDLAIQAALTGHIVFSTLHTNSSAGVLPRLLDMDIEPFLIASTVNTVVGQRLVRRLCDNCKETYSGTAGETDSVKKVLKGKLPKDEKEREKLKTEYGYEALPIATENAYTLYKGVGCKECKDGYKGRAGIYEVFGMSNEIEKLLVDRETSSKIQEQAIKEGMLTMRQDGYLKALNGFTSLEEVNRVTAEIY